MSGSRRTAPVGLWLCTMALLLGGLAFLLTGTRFLVAPGSLGDAGFRPDAPLGVRVAGLLAFGGVAALLAWSAWGLMRRRPFALEVTRALALATAGLLVARLTGDGAGAVADGLGAIAAGAAAVYLSMPSVRRLFRAPRG